MTKKFMWLGFFVGSTIGNLLPALWGGDMMSISGFLLAAVGGIVGIWLGYRWSQSL
jgi:dipeptide/tripeptide permease